MQQNTSIFPSKIHSMEKDFRHANSIACPDLTINYFFVTLTTQFNKK